MNPDEIFAMLITELVEALKEAFAQEVPTFRGLVLLYAAMDIVSSLSRPIGKQNTTRSVFKDWVTSYMLPDSGLKCNAHDIYAARCGILHTLSLSSSDSRAKQAKQIAYLNKADGVERLQKFCDLKGHDVVVVWIYAYLRAFYKGIERFDEKIQTDAELRGRAFHHLGSVANMISFNFRD